MGFENIEFKDVSNASGSAGFNPSNSTFLMEKDCLFFKDKVVDFLDHLIPDDTAVKTQKGVIKKIKTWEKLFTCKIQSSGSMMKIIISTDLDQSDEHPYVGSIKIVDIKNKLDKTGQIFFRKIKDALARSNNFDNMFDILQLPDTTGPSKIRAYKSIDYKLEGNTILIQFDKNAFKDIFKWDDIWLQF